MQNDLNSNKPAVTAQDLRKHFGALPALSDVSLEVAAGEFVCIIGPSGCGKSTLLKIIAGLEVADAGSVAHAGRVAMAFQSGALLPWLTVEHNAAFGLKARGMPAEEAQREVKKYLEMVGLSDMAQRYPRELSGGQRQRVGLARALAVEPQILLLDEPFSALDPKTTEDLHKDIIRIWQQTGVAVVMVSHLIEEAVSLAHRVALMKNGRVEDIFLIDLPYPRRENGLLFHEVVQRIRRKFFE